MSPTRFEFVGRLLLYVAMAWVMLWIHTGLSIWPFDDAFIHIRIAENLIDHQEPYFNPGEAVMASSSPVWTWFLALLYLVRPLDPALIAVVNALLVVSGGWVWGRLAGETGGAGRPRWADDGFALVYMMTVYLSGAGLMETPLAMLVLGGGLLGVARDRAWGFLLLGLAPFVRAELAVFLVAALLLRPPRSWPRVVLWAGAGAAPAVVYDLVYFGRLVPYTAIVKKAVYTLNWGDTTGLLIYRMAPFTFDRLGTTLHSIWPVFLIVALFLSLRRLTWSDATDRLVAVVAGCGSVIAGVYVGSRGFVFPWYVPLFAVPVSFAIWVRIGQGRSRALQWGVCSLLVLPLTIGLIQSAVACAGRPGAFRYFPENARVAKYVEIGRRLHEKYPDATLMTSEIGGLGRGFPGRVVDAVGLISPEALPFHPMAVPDQRSSGLLGAIPPAFVEQELPELIVSMDIFAEALLREVNPNVYRRFREPLFVKRDLAQVREPRLWSSESINVFVRTDLLADE